MELEISLKLFIIFFYYRPIYLLSHDSNRSLVYCNFYLKILMKFGNFGHDKSWKIHEMEATCQNL